MSDDIEVHFDAKRGALRLTCGSETFSRLRNVVLYEAGATVEEVIGCPTRDVLSIGIQSYEAFRPQRRGLLDAMYLVGGILAGILSTMIFVLGVSVIVCWFG